MLEAEINAAKYQYLQEVRPIDVAVMESRASILGVTRLIGKTKSSLIQALGNPKNTKHSSLARYLVESGFSIEDQYKWRSQRVPDTAVIVILEFYAFVSKRYHSPNALKIIRALTWLGALRCR